MESAASHYSFFRILWDSCEKGYKTAKKTSELFGNEALGFSMEKGQMLTPTLQYAYSEWCMSVFADRLGKTEDAEKYRKLSKSYQNVFDHEKGWFRPKKEDGTWEPWPEEGKLKEGYGCRESTPFQKGWYVPHDVDGLAELLGGREATLTHLNEFFDNAPEDMMWSPYYHHGNEPSHHVPFLFNRLGEPWQTQYWSREICKRAYHNNVNGLVGNDDVGQLSAWYVLSASGLYPVCPGDNRYEITSPVFNKVEIKLDPKYAKGETFTIVANNNSDENIYIQSAKLNGTEWNNCWLNHQQITAGGVLELEMGNQPNEEWGTGPIK